MMGRLLNPEGLHDYWRHPEFDRLARGARVTVDEQARADAYRQMTSIFLAHNPWIVMLQPREDYGLRRYVEFTPSPDQCMDLRLFNLRDASRLTRERWVWEPAVHASDTRSRSSDLP